MSNAVPGVAFVIEALRFVSCTVAAEAEFTNNIGRKLAPTSTAAWNHSTDLRIDCPIDAFCICIIFPFCFVIFVCSLNVA